MKEIKILIATLAMSLTFMSGVYSVTENSSAPATDKKKENTESKLTPEQTEVLINRLHEIRSLDKNLLSMHEKKVLRKEVTDIKEELKKQDGVVFYLSGTAILIIILLLILL